MALEKIPTFQEVKDWAASKTELSDHEDASNPHSGSASTNHDNAQHSTNYLPESDYNPESDTHTRYDDNEARSAVDNSNVSVGYADDAGDADTVDGQHASQIGPSDSDIRDAVRTVLASGTVQVGGDSSKGIHAALRPDSSFGDGVCEIEIYEASGQDSLAEIYAFPDGGTTPFIECSLKSYYGQNTDPHDVDYIVWEVNQ